MTLFVIRVSVPVRTHFVELSTPYMYVYYLCLESEILLARLAYSIISIEKKIYMANN